MTEGFSLIDNEESLSKLCNQLGNAAWLAVDTEFERVSTYYPELCLVQISNGITHAVIDPLAIKNMEPLYDLLYQQSIIKVLHSAHQDLELLFNIKGSIPTPLFDTQIAAPLFGYAQGIGYGNLVKEVLEIELDKGHARTDWKKRPLSKDQLRYAVDDAVYLGKIYDVFKEKINKVENLHDFNAQINKLAKPETYQPDPATMWKKIFAAKRLKGKQQIIVKQLAAWREITARERNRPRKWILADHAMIEMAKGSFENKSEFLKIDKVSEKLVSRHGDALLKIIRDSQ
ncbi:MAG: ribonuclease D [Proteobacteria bacterium]|nr:ribonuclease D [Pseudomonadota bacterium]